MRLPPVALFGMSVFASLVRGKALLAGRMAMPGRLRLMQTIHGGTRRFLHSLRKPLVSGQRVVLIGFPIPGMRAVGLVTRVIKDADTGRELAAVHVPTSPNPTSGYIEIVPLADVLQTDWSFEEATSFVITGGANAPDEVRYEAAEKRVGAGEAAP